MDVRTDGEKSFAFRNGVWVGKHFIHMNRERVLKRENNGETLWIKLRIFGSNTLVWV